MVTNARWKSIKPMAIAVFAAFIGLQYSFGVLFDMLLEAFGESRAATAWSISVVCVPGVEFHACGTVTCD